MTTSEYAAELYTQSCESAANGPTAVLDASACTNFQNQQMASGNFTSVTCSYSSEGCRCALTGESTDTSSAPYTISGNQIVYSNGDPPASYCVSGTTLTESSASPSPYQNITLVATLHHT